MYVSSLLALFVLLLASVPSVITLWRLHTSCKQGGFVSVLLKLLVVVIAVFFAAFMVSLEMHWLDWLWRMNEVAVYRLVAVFYCLFLPWAVYSLFNLIDLIGGKRNPNKRWLLRRYLGLPLTLLCCLVLLGGFCRRHHLEIERVEVESKRLPTRFDGAKIVVLTDLHYGTLVGKRVDYLQSIVDSVNALEPDFVFMVGDLVNVYANEVLGPNEILKRIEAKVGKYAVMGNHDYGGYFPFDNETELIANEERMREMYEACGFHLLSNEGAIIAFDEENKINVVGIENWGTGRFPKYGDLNAAMSTVDPSIYTILLSHDPTAWRPLILASDHNIDLTVSGHTHGGQIILFGLSPAMKEFEFWNGLYRQNEQYIYVSRGLGYTIVPLRIGKGPEISLLQLRKSER